MSMQQGGLDLILTMLIVSTPPMAAMFFQGVLGNFTPYSAFNQGQGAVVPPGQLGAGAPIPASVVHRTAETPGNQPEVEVTSVRTSDAGLVGAATSGQRGLAR